MVRTSVTYSAIASCATFLFLPHFDVIYDLLLNRRTATWNLFVKYIFSFYATLQRNVTSGIYYYITTEFDYAKRDSRLAANGGVVLQQFVAYGGGRCSVTNGLNL